MAILAKFFCRSEISAVPAGAAGSPALPAGSTFMLPGHYSYGGQAYDCSREGLYRFLDMSNGSAQNRLVRKLNVADIDLYDFLSGVCWNHVHGVDDNHSDYQGIANAGRSRRWRSTCGNIVGFVAWYFGLIGVPTIIRNPHSVAAANGWDDGHYVLDTVHGTQKRMWDITNKRYFVDSAGVHMSTDSVVASINAGVYPTPVLMAPGAMRFNSQNSGAIDFSITSDMYLRTEAEIEAWYRRMFQAA